MRKLVTQKGKNVLRSFRRQIEELDDEYRTRRDTLRAEFDKHLDAIEAALLARAHRTPVLAVNGTLI